MAETTSAGVQGVDPRRWVVLVVVLTAAFMVLLDISIVNVAIPSIQRNLGATYAQIQFVIAFYALAYAVFLITGGRLGDIYGRKRLFLLGMAGFTLASALCGLAVNPTMLVGSRILQGLMASLMFPQVLSVIQVSFPVRERATAFAVFGATIGLATITGPLLGGLLIEGNLFGLDWRPVFLVNLPVGVGSLVAASILLRESRADRVIRLDLPGVAILTVGLLMLVYPLIEGRDAGWPAWSFISLALSVPVLVSFGFYARYKKRKDNSPLVEPELFRDRAFNVGLLVSAVFFSGVSSFFLAFSLYLQIGLGYTALHSGLTLVPFAVGSFFGSGASARLSQKVGKLVVQVGAALMIAGILGIIYTIHTAGTGIQGWYLVPTLFVTGLGLGAIVAPLINIVLAGIHTGNAGSASGVMTTVQQVGGALGIALIGVILFGALADHADVSARSSVPALMANINRDLVPAFSAAHLPAGDQANILQTIRTTFVRCFDDRAKASDPTSTPKSCAQISAKHGEPPAVEAAVGADFKAAALSALAQNFTHSIQVSLLYHLAVLCLTFLLFFLLPSPDLGKGAQEAAGAH